MAKYVDITALDLISTEWRPLRATITCSRILIENTDAGNLIKFRVEEAGVEKTIASTTQLDLKSEFESWNPNDIIGYITSVAATGRAVAVQTR